MPEISSKPFIDFMRRQLEARPLLGIEDAYKLIYQGNFGGEHLLTDLARARQLLFQEFEAITPAADEPLIETISLSGTIIRLNLRPYKFRQGQPTALFQALQKSAQSVTGTLADFLELWKIFKQAVLRHELPFDEQQLLQFDQKVQAENYPPQHHSTAYRQAYRPAYRILTRHLAEALVRQLPPLAD